MTITRHILEQSKAAARAKRLADINELIDEAVRGDYHRVVTVGDFGRLLQERNAIMLQLEAEHNRAISTPSEREAAVYESSHHIAFSTPKSLSK